jgi:dipeptidyl aminopeptidase/acylaminoacyl peptidase
MFSIHCRAALLALPAIIVCLQPGARGQERTVAPGPTLVVEGVPAIPLSIADDVRRYTESRSASFVDWHPTRREMLVSTRFANAPQIHHVAMPGGDRKQLTFFDEPITQASFEPVAGRYFVFSKDVGGNEFRQLYRFDLESHRITLLTDGGRSQNGGVVWSRRGDRIAYASTRRNGADRDLYTMNPSDPRSDRLLLQVSGGGWGVMDWSADDTKLLVKEEISVTKSNLWLVDVATSEKIPLLPQTGDVSFDAAQFSPDNRGLFLTTDKDSEFLRLAYVDLSTKAVTPITTDLQWDVERFDVSHDGRTIAFVSNEAGLSKLYLLDTASRRYHPAKNTPAGVIFGVKWRKNAREVGFTLGSARTGADAFVLNADDGQVVRWTESELGGLVPSELSEGELIRWPSFDGREITGFLYRPAAKFTGRRPVVINIHGGPEAQYRPLYQGRSNYYLNELGVAIIYPNVRGSTGYGKTFVELDNGIQRLDSVKDIGSLLDWIARQPGLDPSRVMVVGGSYGGYMTLAVATMYNDRIRCAVDIVGISNFNTFLKNTESYRRDLRRVEYGDERDPAVSAFFEETAPLTNAHRINTPLFVVQGGNDPRVPRTESEQMVARVRQNRSPVWYLMATDEGHGFVKKSNVDFQFYATVMFARQYLLQ